MVNTQNSPEYRALLEQYEAGINVKNGDVQGVADALRQLYEDENLRKAMSGHAKAMFTENLTEGRTI